ncbi:GL14419 [Drosophila persimilis]|uniref:GL14419 n=1 Tax=Drosophila persimilis TaxID=7234 RepID=B4GTT9_DROPE|nr:GL14419 [Drosophila persimilis]
MESNKEEEHSGHKGLALQFSQYAETMTAVWLGWLIAGDVIKSLFLSLAKCFMCQIASA